MVGWSRIESHLFAPGHASPPSIAARSARFGALPMSGASWWARGRMGVLTSVRVPGRVVRRGVRELASNE